MNFSETIFLFFSFLAVLLALLLMIKKKGDRKANILLGIYLLLFGYNIIYNVLYWSKELYSINYLHIIATNQLVWVLYGPILYLYVRQVVFPKKWSAKDLIHGLPFLFFVINSIAFSSLSTKDKIDVLVNGSMNDYIMVSYPYSIIAIITLMFFYASLILFSFSKDMKSLNQKKWLKWVGYSFVGYVVSFTSYFVLQRLGFIEIGYDHFIGFSMIFFIALVSYFGFLQPQVFDGLPVENLLAVKKYTKTGLTETHSKELKQALLELMHIQKPYLESELKLNDLANQLNLSRHHMSQVINEHFDSNFFDFINTYRIEEAKNLLSKDSDRQISDILYASGFNNRVSFNKAFKKQTGTTPSQYKSTHLSL